MNKKELLEFSKKYAKSQGFKLQEDKEILDFILEGLLKNEKKYGFRYCPCKIPNPKLKIDVDIICPCKEFREEGKCICKLFNKK